MFAKRNKVYADAGKYLRHKSGRAIALTVVGNIEDWEEHDLDADMSVEVEDGKIYINRRMFLIRPSSLDYATVKTRIIMSRYSNDDQMALILNNGKSEQDTLLYNKMQEWREWAGVIAKQVTDGNY